MEYIFTYLTQAVEGSAFIALVASLIWGILSILLSPCHLASIPLIVGFINGQGKTSTRRAFLTSSCFSFGILITIAVLGGITAMAGKMLGDTGGVGNYFVAIIFFLVGLHLWDIIPMPWSGLGHVGMKSRGLWAALILGLIFGIALGPCTFAYMTPVLAVAFKSASANFTYGVSLLLFYGIGHCSVIVFAGTFTKKVQLLMDWNESSKGTIVLKRICGVLVLLGGLYLIYTV